MPALLHLARMRAVLIGALAMAAACQTALPPSPPPPTRTLDPAAPLFFDAFTVTAQRGSVATATIHTQPGVSCAAVFLWPGSPSGGQPVPSASADPSGVVPLRWTIDPATPAGSWRIDATCGGRTVSTHVPVD